MKAIPPTLLLLLAFAGPCALAAGAFDFQVTAVRRVDDAGLLPVEASLTFTDASVAAGIASGADIVSVNISFGSVVLATLPGLASSTQSASFSADGSLIESFVADFGSDIGACTAPCGSWFASPASPAIGEVEFGIDRFDSTSEQILRFDGAANSADPVVSIVLAGEWVRRSTAVVAVDDQFQVLAGEVLSVEAPGILDNDRDAEGEDLPTGAAAEQLTDVEHGVLQMSANGGFTYEPAAGFEGTDMFTYRARVGEDLSNDARVTLTVSGCQTSPTGFVSLPHVPFGLTSWDLIAQIGGPNEVRALQRFNTSTGRFETTVQTDASIVGHRFDIRAGEGYLVHMNTAREVMFPRP